MRDDTKMAAEEASLNLSVPFLKKSIAGHILSSKIGSVRAVFFSFLFFPTGKLSPFLRYRSLATWGREKQHQQQRNVQRVLACTRCPGILSALAVFSQEYYRQNL